MSTEAYDQAEKLYCGKWEIVKNEMDEFLTAGEFPDAVKTAIKGEKVISLVREGNSIHLKSQMAGVESDFLIKIDEETEWKEKEENPAFHLKTSVTSFKDGVWTEEFTPVKPDGGKKHILVVTVKDGQLNFDLSFPDNPGVCGKRVFKRCE